MIIGLSLFLVARLYLFPELLKELQDIYITLFISKDIHIRKAINSMTFFK